MGTTALIIMLIGIIAILTSVLLVVKRLKQLKTDLSIVKEYTQANYRKEYLSNIHIIHNLKIWFKIHIYTRWYMYTGCKIIQKIILISVLDIVASVLAFVMGGGGLIASIIAGTAGVIITIALTFTMKLPKKWINLISKYRELRAEQDDNDTNKSIEKLSEMMGGLV